MEIPELRELSQAVLAAAERARMLKDAGAPIEEIASVVKEADEATERLSQAVWRDLAKKRGWPDDWQEPSDTSN